MIKVFCRKCGQSLQEQGALIISPPETTQGRMSVKVYKMHICISCYFMLMDWFSSKKTQTKKEEG
jgi:hypothetical protein